MNLQNKKKEYVNVFWKIPIVHIMKGLLQVHLNKLECRGKVHLFQ